MPTPAQVVAYAQALAEPDKDVLDVVLLALVAENLDPILSRVRGRKQVMELLTQLSMTTSAVTATAAALGVELDGSPLAEDSNFTNWPPSRLASLGTAMLSLAQQLKQTAESQAALTAIGNKQHEADQAMIKKMVEQANQTAAVTEASIDYYRKATVAATTELNAHQDIDMFVVARIDPVTKKPSRFLKDDGEAGLRGVASLGAASKFTDYTSAHDLRVSVVAALRAKGRRTADVGSTVAVMRLSMREVTLADLDD